MNRRELLVSLAGVPLLLTGGVAAKGDDTKEAVEAFRAHTIRPGTRMLFLSDDAPDGWRRVERVSDGVIVCEKA